MGREMETACPKCSASIFIGDFNDIGDEVSCDSCYTQYEITGISPLRIKPVNDKSKRDRYSEYGDEIDDEFDREDDYEVRWDM